MSLTPEKITALKAQYGNDLHKITIGEDVFVLRPPSRPEWQRFEKTDDGRRENLLRYCVVFPDNAGLEAALDRKPGHIVNLTQKAVELAGVAEKVHDEKL